MRRIQLITVLTLLSSLALFADESRVILSIMEALSASDEDYAQRRPLALHGKVTANGLDNMTLFEDETGTALVSFVVPDDSHPKAGSVITFKGDLRKSQYGDRMLYASSYVVERIEAPPPPISVTIPQLLQADSKPMFIQTSGTVVEVYPDEVDANFTYIILSSQGKSVHIAAYRRDYSFEDLVKLVNAEIRVTGLYDSTRYWRRFTPPLIESPSRIEVITSAPANPFDLEPIDTRNTWPSSNQFGTRRSAKGTVLATWQGNNILLKSRENILLLSYLAHGSSLPQNGQSVEMAGLIDTDGSHLLLRDAIWRPSNVPPAFDEPPEKISARSLFLDSNGKTAIQYDYYGRLIQLEGRVLTIQSSNNIGSQLLINNENFTIPVDVSGCPSAAEGVEVGYRISVTGICLIDFDSWRQGAPLPHIRGIKVIVREANDIQILSRPSPFTTRRLTAVILVLLLGLAVFFAWNRQLRKLIDRKSRELFRSQISRAESKLRVNERTRLAAELHDDTLQGLTAVAYRISEAQSSLCESKDETRDNLQIAAKMLKSCRTNLRRCLWDLRSDVLDDPDFGHAIVRTIENVAGDAQVRVRFSGRRSLLRDTVAHAILNILRELVANAVNHGHASEIKIAGECHQGALYVSVRDNGVGFDPENRPTQEDGHFGIDGIEGRLAHLGGSLSIKSSTGRGTYVRLAITASTQQNGNSPS